MGAVKLSGPVGAVVMISLVLLALGTIALASYQTGTAPGRSLPRWALGCMIAAFVLNGMGNLFQVFLLRMLVVPAQLVATIIVIVELVTRRRRRETGTP